MSLKVAVVTGANKGIGFGIVKGLCQNFTGKIYLTARNENRGKEAVRKLRTLGLMPVFHQLDINDEASIYKFKNYIEEHEGGIDILINNAAIAFRIKAVEPVSIQAEETIRTNYFGTLQVCQALFPLLRSGAQVVNVSSVAGFLLKIPSLELQSKLGAPNFSINDLNKIVNQYVSDAKVGKNIQNDWGNSSYTVSKVGLCALTVVQQKVFNQETKNRNISVNSVHPGYVRTDMTNHQGILSIEEGAIAPLFLALGHHPFKGQFIWNDCTVVDWYGPPKPGP